MLPDVVLEGEKVRLRPVAEADLPSFVEWLNDPEVNRWLALSPSEQVDRSPSRDPSLGRRRRRCRWRA